MQQVVTIGEMFDEAMTKVGRYLPIIDIEAISLAGDVVNYRGRLTFTNKTKTKTLAVGTNKSVAKRNPMHTMNGTFNIQLIEDDSIKTVHVNLVRMYNNKKVALNIHG